MMVRRQKMSSNPDGMCFLAGAGSGVRRVSATCLLAGSSLLYPAAAVLAQQAGNNQPTPASDNSQPSPAADTTVELEEVEVTGQRLDLLGTATTASQGVIDNEEIQLTPVYRPGQILETIPGLTVTSHSGEGKAKTLAFIEIIAVFLQLRRKTASADQWVTLNFPTGWNETERAACRGWTATAASAKPACGGCQPHPSRCPRAVSDRRCALALDCLRRRPAVLE
jgi:hypothetical protein